jgi:prenylcysteine oxidase/farnesylcysteine lyase
VIWVYRKTWASYPIAPPFGQDEVLPAFKPDNASLFYTTSAMEKWVSTMETQTVSAWNVVSLVVRDLFGYHVDRSWAEWDAV